MCGLSGIYNYKSLEPISERVLKAMNDTLVHRGPDDEGFYVCKEIGLGHRRLSIIDLAAGHQPMTNEDGTVWVAFNGEIYNFGDLHRYLEAKGHQFKTRSDTEVIVHLYEEKGEDCFRELRGMFAIAIWDQSKRKLLLARDRVGKKPLYYLTGSGHIQRNRSRSAFRLFFVSLRARAEIDFQKHPQSHAGPFFGDNRARSA
jgi:asparagine synthase (glutamine-hydrolysing)